MLRTAEKPEKPQNSEIAKALANSVLYMYKIPEIGEMVE